MRPREDDSEQLFREPAWTPGGAGINHSAVALLEVRRSQSHHGGRWAAAELAVLCIGSNLGQWTVYVTCRECGRKGKVIPPQLTKLYGPEHPVHPLLKKLVCRGCGSRRVIMKIQMRLDTR